MKLLRPLADSVRLNTPLPWNVLNAQHSLLLSKGSVLHEEKQVEMLLERGMYVDDTDRTSAAPVPLDRAQAFNPFAAWDEVYQRLGASLNEHTDEPEFLQKIAGLISQIRELTRKDTDAAIFVMVQSDQPRYAIAHSLQAGFLCALIAERLDWPEPTKISLIAAALTMNIAMINLQTQLSKQAYPLTDEQRTEIHSHPLRSRQRLEKLGVTDAQWLHAVEEHHEAEGGAGYPKGAAPASRLAEIVRDTDKYWAMVSPRDYRKPLPPSQVARTLYMNAASPGDSVASLIVKELGIYPPGSYVRLANGEVAVVTSRGEKANAPGVCSFRDGKGAAFIQPLHRKTSNATLSVVESVPADEIIVALNPSKLFGYGYQL